jgi:hypothetical protein
MRLAIILCFTSQTLFCQSITLKKLFQIFDASVQETDTMLKNDGYTAVDLDTSGKPKCCVTVFSSEGWINKKGEREQWEYYRDSSSSRIGIYCKGGQKSIGEVRTSEPMVDTGALFTEMREMNWDPLIPGSDDVSFINKDESIIVVAFRGTSGNFEYISISRKGDEVFESSIALRTLTKKKTKK